jgi:carbamoyl-phosphate synthase large subunit
MINILITGAGSVMGQSIYRALCNSNYEKKINVHFFNSDEKGAGFYFNSSNRPHKIPVVKTTICPIASSDEYIPFIKKYIEMNNIDICFSGTQHEIEKIALLNDSIGKAAVLASNILKLTLDKQLTVDLLNKYNVPAPISYTLEEAIKNKIEIIGIVKPNYSSASRNIFKSHNYLELIEISNKIPKNLWGKYVFQEFLDGEEFTCSCFLDKYSKSKKFLVMKRDLSPDGASVYGRITHDPLINNYLSLVLDAFEKQGMEFGNINVQLRLTKKGPLLFEINGRLSSTEAPKSYFGFNTVEAFIDNIYYKKA